MIIIYVLLNNFSILTKTIFLIIKETENTIQTFNILYVYILHTVFKLQMSKKKYIKKN